MLGLNQVAHLSADVDDGTLGVLGGDEFVPSLALLRRGHQGQLQPGQRLAQSPGTAALAAAAMARGRLLDASLAVQAAHGFVAIRCLQLAATVEEAEFAAHEAGKRAPADVAGLRQPHLQGSDGG